ncbi:MAG: peptidase MA family metallohydrolase [Candidatus Omnitrophica bacterium]|nr:peptidase MA family metallohydrolase [Candidatus Omnitrophota bacterium]
MKRYFVCLLAVFISANFVFAQDWNTAKSTHFIIYYKNAPGGFIDELTAKAENYYDKIADDLGFRRYNFWLWDNRAKIYIYDDEKDYQAARGQPSWSSGCAYPREKVIYSFPYAKKFFDTILPHEMGHIVFREFVGFDNPAVPAWLDEGVASYQQELRFSGAGIIVKDALGKNKLMSLSKLNAVNPQILTDADAVNLFYAQAVSVVDYLIKEFGRDRFVVFCQTLRDKKNLDKALIWAYSFQDTGELDQAWRSYLSR